MRQQWEYCAIYFKDKWIIRYQQANYKVQEVKSLEEAMEKLGYDGWELVTIVNPLPSGVQARTFYFKRQM